MTVELSKIEEKPLILIVDDTPANLQLLADILKQRGYDVRVAPSGQLALDFIRRKLPDLILLDIAMPHMDGYEVCRRLKANAIWQSIPVIFISASAEEQDKVRSFKAGGVDYVTKPFQSAEVEARVETQLNLYRYQRQLELLVQEKVREISEVLERAAKAEKMGMLGVILAGIAHEINQPLNVLKMRADSLLYWEAQGNLPPVGEIMQDVQIISKCAGQVGGIIQHMRSLAWDQKPDRTDSCSVLAAVNHALLLTGPRLTRHGISVGMEPGDSASTVRMNAVQLEQILINLLSNSLQALTGIDRPEKTIILRITEDKQAVTLEVADNGPGIPAMDRDRIFEPFYSTGGGGENMGLGLLIIKKIIRSYDGEIWATDNSMGGASVIVRIPASAAGENWWNDEK